MGGPLRAMLLIALLPFASAKTYYTGTYNTYNSHNPEVATSSCTYNESCYAVDYCAIKHNNDDMITFRDGRVCDDLNGQYFKSLKWNENIKECRICNNRRKGRKLLGGPIPLNLAPKQAGGPVCCAMKPEECCMQNPYAPSGLPYDAASKLVLTFNVLFWIYVVLMGLYLWNLPSFMNNGRNDTVAPSLAEKPGVQFFWVSWFTILFWTFLLWFPLYIVASFGYMLYYKREMADRQCCGFFDIFSKCCDLIQSCILPFFVATRLSHAACEGHTEIVKALLAAPNIEKYNV